MPNRMIIVHRTPADAENAFAGVFLFYREVL